MTIIEQSNSRKRNPERVRYDHHTSEVFDRRLHIGKWSWIYPRERLYRELPVLLEVAGDATSIDWPLESMRFLAVWNRFSSNNQIARGTGISPDAVRRHAGEICVDINDSL